MVPIWEPSGADGTQMGPTLATGTLLSGVLSVFIKLSIQATQTSDYNFDAHSRFVNSSSANIPWNCRSTKKTISTFREMSARISLPSMDVVCSTFFSCPRTVQIPHSYRCAKYKIVKLPAIGELSWALFAVENLPEIETYHLRSHPSLKTTHLTAPTATISTGQRTLLPCAIGMSLYCIQWRCSCHSIDKRLA